jgi:hypothetical protein
VTAATLASVPAYLLAARIVAWVTGVPLDARTRLSGLLGDAPAKLVTMVDAVSLSLWPTPGLISRFDSAVLLALLLVSSAGLVWSLLRGRRWTAAILCLGLLGIGLLWSAGASALGDVVWLVPRTMVGICVFAAGLVMLGWRVRQGRVWHTVLGAGLVVLTIGYVGASNQILFDQWVLNRWDTQQATRILARLEVEPGYEDLHALAIIGGLPGYPSALQTMGGDMNASALAISWGKLGLIEQATGYRFASPTETELADAKAQCEGIDPWPAPGSILVRQGLGIVCLPQ